MEMNNKPTVHEKNISAICGCFCRNYLQQEYDVKRVGVKLNPLSTDSYMYTFPCVRIEIIFL